MKLLDTQAVLNEGLAALRCLDPVMARIIAAGAVPPLRKRAPGFAGLCQIIVSQQLSTASANAIWARVEARFPRLSPDTIAAAPDADLRAAGLSAPKIRTLRAIAAAVGDGALPLDALQNRPADEAHRLTTTVNGIGPWSADN